VGVTSGSAATGWRVAPGIIGCRIIGSPPAAAIVWLQVIGSASADCAKVNDKDARAAEYERLDVSLRTLIRGQSDFLANISNFAALLFTTLPDLNWAGFYLLRGNDLVLGPFQGKPACACIAVGDGVCGAAALQRASIIVPDVHAFPGHIVCDEASQSEMVLPVFKHGRLVGVLDLDSPLPERFDELDRDRIQYLLHVLMDGTLVPEFRLAPS